jgi:predicted DNA-binding ribbon-helix-helix protein
LLIQRLARQKTRDRSAIREARMPDSRVIKRSVKVDGHKTSVSLEAIFWKGLKEIAGRTEKRITEILSEIDKTRRTDNLSSAIRIFVLEEARQRAASPELKSDRTACGFPAPESEDDKWPTLPPSF